VKKHALMEGKEMFRDRLTFTFPEYGVDVSTVENVVQDLVRKGGESINLRGLIGEIRVGKQQKN